MSIRVNLTSALALLAATAVLAGCTVSPSPFPTTTGLTGPDGTINGDGNGGGGGGGDPFPPETPTTTDGWTARYQNVPWLADDLDNDDFFVTGTLDGHEVMGIYCNNDGNPSSSLAISVSDTDAEVHFQRGGIINIDVQRGRYFHYTGIGTFSLPDPQGTHPISIAYTTSIPLDDSPEGKGKASQSTASVDLQFLGVPFPDPATCKTDASDLFIWVNAQSGRP
ncbi:MAG: hypothetical protein ABIR17_11465 [Pseudolysinimonas sp.]|uniref:hypothetical protein n=1 Tax=Pseudolysinimonas sp. TaxID=2680009 RepID=UPI003266F0E7